MSALFVDTAQLRYCRLLPDQLSLLLQHSCSDTTQKIRACLVVLKIKVLLLLTSVCHSMALSNCFVSSQVTPRLSSITLSEALSSIV